MVIIRWNGLKLAMEVWFRLTYIYVILYIKSVRLLKSPLGPHLQMEDPIELILKTEIPFLYQVFFFTIWPKLFTDLLLLSINKSFGYTLLLKDLSKGLRIFKTLRVVRFVLNNNSDSYISWRWLWFYQIYVKTTWPFWVLHAPLVRALKLPIWQDIRKYS